MSSVYTIGAGRGRSHPHRFIMFLDWRRRARVPSAPPQLTRSQSVIACVRVYIYFYIIVRRVMRVRVSAVVVYCTYQLVTQGPAWPVGLRPLTMKCGFLNCAMTALGADSPARLQQAKDVPQSQPCASRGDGIRTRRRRRDAGVGRVLAHPTLSLPARPHPSFRPPRPAARLTYQLTDLCLHNLQGHKFRPSYG